MPKRKTLIKFILDRTGSMSVIRDETIVGFNEYITTLRAGETQKNMTLSLMQFDTEGLDTLYEDAPLDEVELLTRSTYKPRANTNLYDAVGKGIRDLEKMLSKARSKPAVIFVVMTDVNEDLVEATALGHDLGHTPFGHIGEKVLDRLLDGGFHHSRQSVRIVETLEKGGSGLNLTGEVIEGIRRHSKPQGNFLSREAVVGMSLEAQTVRVSDAIAYLTHDINDAIRAGAITIEDLPAAAIERLGQRHSRRVDAVITGIIEGTLESMPEADASADAGADANAEQNGLPPLITMPDDLAVVTNDLRDFMFERVYLPLSDSEQGLAAQRVTEALFEHYVASPDHVTPELRSSNESLERRAADMVCGMTDQFALRTA